MSENALGVYVHWPFCARLCPYCDFNIYKNREIDTKAWADALSLDLEYWAARIAPRKLTSLYFGGGTPSLAPVQVVEAAINKCDALFGFHPQAEITLEANPTDAEQTHFKDLAAIGVNRLSLGVQSLRDDALKFLGRNHSVDEARMALARALEIFPRVNSDLIYARPGQSLEDWRDELTEMIALGVSHLSLYQLTLEPGTAFAAQTAAGRWAPADEETCAAQFEAAQEITAAAGLPAYETSNHASLANQSQHNLLYWRYQDYIGIGPGAHGRLTIGEDRIATIAHKRPEAYLEAVEQQGHGAAEIETLSAEAQLIERLTMGLRLAEGVTLYADDVFYEDDARVDRLHELEREGYLTLQCGRLQASEKGRPLLNRLLYELLG